jgi:NADPH:quinone reductase-like Zn-dependent oxidoreductase
VLIQGATGVTGKLAVQIAKRLGAGRVIASGRNPQALEKLRCLGADSTIQLDQPDDDLRKAFSQEAGRMDSTSQLITYGGGPLRFFSPPSHARNLPP